MLTFVSKLEEEEEITAVPDTQISVGPVQAVGKEFTFGYINFFPNGIPDMMNYNIFIHVMVFAMLQSHSFLMTPQKLTLIRVNLVCK